MKLKEKKFTLTYALVQCFYWFCYGTALSYASPYLLACGLSNTAIGLISAAACALSVGAQPLLAAYADREGSLSVKTLVLMMGAGILSLGGALIFVYGKSEKLNGLLLGCAILLVEISLPFVNALATETINAGKPLDFSFARGAGSVGYAIMSVTIGNLIAKRGAGALPYALTAFALLSGRGGPFPLSQTGMPGNGKSSAFRRAIGFFQAVSRLRRHPGGMRAHLREPCADQ